MKKLFFLIITYSSLSAQSNLSKYENDTLITSTGFKVYKGLNLKIGTGSMPDGDFKFIRVNANSMFAYHSTTGYQGLANQANSFKREYSGLTFEVKKIMERGTKKNGYIYYAKIMATIVGYEIDIENAIKTGEIEVPEEFKPRKETQIIEIKQTISPADELKKFKDLLDSGVITQEEFDTQKKKILEK